MEKEQLEEISRTHNSVLYKIEREGLSYVLKENISANNLKKEQKMSQDVYNFCNKKVSIPIRGIEELEDGKRVAVMEYEMHGLFLSEIIDQLEQRYIDAIPLHIQAALLEAILRALREVHSCEIPNRSYKGYLHLDLHPGNIFFENISLDSMDSERIDMGTVRFLDWQNSLSMDEDGYAYCEERLGFTPGFSSPEHMHRGKYSKASDLYSVAAIGARLYTGRNISLHDLDSYYEIVEEDSRIHSDNPIAHDLMQSMLLCGLDDNIKYRYQDTSEMLDMVKHIEESVESFQNYCYFNLFKTAYKARIPEHRIKVEELIFDENGFEISVDLLGEELHQQYIEQQQCYYIAMLLYKFMNQYDDRTDCEMYKMALHKNTLKACNHVGDTQSADDIMKQVNEKYPEYAEGITNSRTINYEDTLRFEEGYEAAKRYKTNIEKILVPSRNIGWVVQEQETELGRTISNCGRFAAYMDCCQIGRDVKPYEWFDKALEAFNKLGDKDNYEITLTHYLQYALAKKDVRSFEKYITVYFGDYPEEHGKTLETWLNRLLTEKDKTGHIKIFHIYTLLKAVFTFYNVSGENNATICSGPYVTPEFIRLLKTSIVENAAFEGLHPQMLIYKYIALIFYEYRNQKGEDLIDEELIRYTFDKSLACMTGYLDNPIIAAIWYQTKWMYQHYCDNGEGNVELYGRMKKYSIDTGWTELTQLLDRITVHDMGNLLVYEHC